MNDLVAKTAYKRPKCIAEIHIKNIVTIVISCESKDAIERFLVLNPPVAAILNAWFTASKSGIPDAQRARKDEAVRAI